MSNEIIINSATTVSSGGSIPANITATSIALGTNPAQSGPIRLAYGETIMGRNNINTTDLSLISSLGNLTTLGDTVSSNGLLNLAATGSTHYLARIGATDYLTVSNNELHFATNNYGIHTYVATGFIFLQGEELKLTNNFAQGTAIRVLPIYNGAAQVLFTNTTTSATIASEDNTTNSATAMVTTILGQNATGTTATGGDIVIGPGSGTTASGKLKISNATINTTPGIGAAKQLHIWINGAEYTIIATTV